LVKGFPGNFIKISYICIKEKPEILKLSREFKVGIVFIVAIAALIWGLNYLKGFDLFKKHQTYYAIYPTVNGLEKSNPVFINGLKVGHVSDIYFSPDYSGLIVVVMSVTTELPIPDNTIAGIYSSDLMGSKAIELIMGNSPTNLKDLDTLASRVDPSLKEAVNQQIQPLKNKAEDLIRSIDSVVVMVQAVFNKKSREDIANALESIKNTLNSLESASYNIDTIVKSQAGRLANILYNLDMITSNIENNNDKIDRIIDNFASISDSLAKAEIPKTFNNINRTVNDLSLIADKINSGQGSLGQLINDDELYNNLIQASQDLDKLLLDIQNNPKRYVRFSVF